MNNKTQTSSVTENIVKIIYDEVKNLLAGSKLTASNAVTIVVSLMQLIEKYHNLGGSQKKQVILDALNMLIDDNNDNVEDSAQLKILVQVTLPTVIDTIVSVDRKELKIKIKKTYTVLYKLCC